MQWEYKARNLGKVAGMLLEKDFNKMGEEGWEFVAMVSGGREGYAIFKRPLQSHDMATVDAARMQVGVS
jgi:hypothetical protein